MNTELQPPRARLRMAIACAVVALVVAIGLWLLLPSADDASPRGAVTQHDSHRSQPITPAASAPDTKQNDTTATDTSLPLRLDVSLCNAAFGAAESGIGWVEMQVRLALQARTTERDVREILKHAVESSIPLERAAGLHWQAKEKASATRSLLAKQLTGCGPGQACAKEFENAIAAATLPERDAIAQLAMSSADPQLYALAYRTCKQRTDGFCQHITATQWAQRDPANGTAWLYVASEAKAVQQNQAYEDALYRLSNSTHFDSGHAALGATIDTLSAQTESPSALLSLASKSLGSMAEGPNYLFVVDDCKGDALQNPNRQQVCDRIANTLVQSGDTLFARAAGVGMGSSLNWAPERMAKLREEQDALLAMRESAMLGAAPGATAEAAALSSCRGMMRQAVNMRRDLRLGQIGSLKAQVAEQTESLSALAQRHRDRNKTVTTVAP